MNLEYQIDGLPPCADTRRNVTSMACIHRLKLGRCYVLAAWGAAHIQAVDRASSSNTWW